MLQLAGDTLHGAAVMLWETLWALVLGFAGSAALQAFVRQEDMVRHFGRPDLRSVGSATVLGAVSSSCSYAAAAAARRAFSKGAHLVPTLAFMFAATNLVLELGCVLWILMGWRFVLAEFVGAFVLIAIMWLLVSLVWSRKLEEAARSRVNAEDDGGDCCHGHHHPEQETPARLARVADAFFMDVGMMWKEILIGFFLAALFMALVPPGALQVLFLHGGPPVLRLVENSVMGVLIAALSCVCSVGNVPLATALWSGGISFGGVVSFVYADLVILPLLFLYRKYYGGRAAAVIVAILGASMILAGLAVDLLFQLFGLVPQGARPPSPVQMAHFAWNYTSWLDLLALAVMAALAAARVRSSAPAKPHAAVLTHHSHP